MKNAATNGLAFLKAENNSVIIGHGPFKEFTELPETTSAFYCNNFELSDPRPWKVPASITKTDQLDVAASAIEIQWDELESENFAEIFSEINEMITRGVMEKSVPVATERGKVVSGEPSNLLGSMKMLGSPFYSYGWVSEKEGFCGATPELLFKLRDQDLKTMALAGTAKSDEREVFAVDGKEIREHEFVSQTLVAKLSDIGNVHRAERDILDLGELVHFHTSIDVELFAKREVEDLIRRLHPTPALGPLPRTEETLSLLTNWRNRLGCPEKFGAPFGLWHEGEFTAVVAIRGVFWTQDELCVPSGCGVIEASRLVNEWRELRLKREAIKSTFGL